jgi:hypothetical protein
MDIYPLSYKSKYERWYYNIIAKAKCQHRSKHDDTYYESHHIVPRSLGGKNTLDNLVFLTYREHVLCHWLLYKFTQGEDKSKMAFAFWAMCQLKNDRHQRKVTPLRILEAARVAHIKELSKTVSGKGNPMYGSEGGFLGKKHTKEHIEKISGEGNPMFGKTHSPEARERIAAAQRARKGHTKSEETKRKMSENAKRRRKKNLPNGKWTWYYPND